MCCNNAISYIGLLEIFKLTTLKSLNICGFREKKFTGISRLINLENLNVLHCTLDDGKNY